ncbi:MAG: enoyl-CoA hydratase/isomerase family protein [Rhodoferax sp.]|jgi:enoyl-CoA hydratase/carnithine racemase|nr:enoyl-CoA hydratase/isomerase family protein [Rhodoferax sp.]
MTAHIEFHQQQTLARVCVHYPERFNAMSRAMWLELRAVFEAIQRNRELRCVLISGEGAHFCAGGDISEYASFRFQEHTLREFHEVDVWPGLNAMLACDVPIVAEIRGTCMGAGVELASCCDIRLAAASAKFGAPIAKLGFPMAPREVALMARELGAMTARQMLLEAAVLDAATLAQRGFLTRVVADDALAGHAQDTVQRMLALAPQAARLNKQLIRASNSAPALMDQALTAINSAASENPQSIPPVAVPADAYAYADSAEHREGITAFLEKRPPVF